MSSELSFLDLFLEASILVQAVMLILLAASVASWAMIFQRHKILQASEIQAKKFEDRFWSGIELNKLYTEVSARPKVDGLENLFKSGFKEYVRLHKSSGRSPESVMDGTQRAMRVSLSREIDGLETHLSFLATVGSISPYIGLFGTVWGIMNAFIALGEVQQATLQMVAPGIAEALIATAMGLFAAIPAVIAYNRFSHKVERLENSFANFIEEFSTILHRQTFSNNADKGTT